MRVFRFTSDEQCMNYRPINIYLPSYRGQNLLCYHILHQAEVQHTAETSVSSQMILCQACRTNIFTSCLFLELLVPYEKFKLYYFQYLSLRHVYIFFFYSSFFLSFNQKPVFSDIECCFLFHVQAAVCEFVNPTNQVIIK